MTRVKFVREVNRSTYDNYYVREINGIHTPCNKPDSNQKNNLGYDNSLIYKTCVLGVFYEYFKFLRGATSNYIPQLLKSIPIVDNKA